MRDIEFRTSLRILGDDLDPDEITRNVGCSPSRSCRMGEPWITPGGTPLACRTGSWILDAPGNLDCPIDDLLDMQALWLLSKCHGHRDFWTEISKKYEVHLFIGIFLGEKTNAFFLGPKTMNSLSEIGIGLDFHLYDSEMDV
ncbi:MAG: DUF4279 domain-containing protein [Pseudomonadota bacterium]